MKKLFTLSTLLLTAYCCAAAVSAPSPVVSWQKQRDGVVFRLQNGMLKLTVCTPSVIRVTYARGARLPATKSLSVIETFKPSPFTLAVSSGAITIKTSAAQARVSKTTGAVQFLSASGTTVLSEAPSGKDLTPVLLPGSTPVNSYAAQDDFVMPVDEGIYGLGQHQQGWLDYHGHIVTLEQENREVGIPFLVSSRGYGLFWDNPSGTQILAGGSGASDIPATALIDASGKSGGLTAQYFTGQDFETPVSTEVDPKIDFDWSSTPPTGLPHDDYSVRWTGSVRATLGGSYTFATVSDDGVRLWIDDRQVIDDWSVHATQSDTASVRFAANSVHSIRLEYFQASGGSVIHLTWSTPSDQQATLTWKSEAADAIDYYWIYGPALESVIRQYRHLTGEAPMPGKWALGFWQSKERYQTQREWIDIAEGYRSRREPIDNIVQDWYYWAPHPWGSHLFDASRYPDPAAGIAALHDKYHMHFMISVWARFSPGTPDNPNANYDALDAKGYLLPAGLADGRFYDAFNPGARAMYWQQMRDELFSKGVDAWWLDASEPELDMQAYRRVQTAAGLGAQVLNAYPLMHTTAVYQGQRAATSAKRVFILTRSAYAGQQRNAAATWSGDITASWKVFANQIPAGLNFCLSGIPYWTTDIGGFFVPPGQFPGGSANPTYQELFTRWFEFGAFCPIFRAHGTNTPRELWRFGPDEPILAKYDNLRYRLLPYIYSQSWQVTHNGSTIMRALVMDFADDARARELSDEYMFGPAFLVCPVTQPGSATRSVYLPHNTTWIDFWSGDTHSGGTNLTASAPLAKMPLFIRAGSIVPMGPELQYAAEKPEDPTEVRIYPGANGAFTLYEDENDNYDYEKGVYSTIPISWNNNAHTLTIGARRGRFPGMLAKRTFDIVWVRPGHGVGAEVTTRPDAIVHYKGLAVTVKAASAGSA